MENNKMENKVKKEYIGVANEQDIKEWKNRYRKVVQIEIEDDEAVYVAYLHSPDMKTMRAAMDITKKDETAATEMLIKNCWIDGARAMLDDGLLYIQLATQVEKMFGSAVGRLKNL